MLHEVILNAGQTAFYAGRARDDSGPFACDTDFARRVVRYGTGLLAGPDGTAMSVAESVAALNLNLDDATAAEAAGAADIAAIIAAHVAATS